MVSVSAHVDNMECYSCHSSWAPQCYGCHVRADFSGEKSSFDWVAAGQEHLKPQHRSTRGEGGFDTVIPGHITETRSYMRWEDPALGVNGEGRVTPLIPGCQVSATVIGENGEELARNHIFRTPPGSEGSGAEGQLSLDMSPVQPHTSGKARKCESCHGSAKAMGYGIPGPRPPSLGLVVELATAEGQVIPARREFQIEPVAGLDSDWSAVVTADSKQLQTVGHHFKGSGPLSAAQRDKLDRRNVCIGCHSQIPEESLAVNLLHHIAEVSGLMPVSNSEHAALLRKILLGSAWMQVAGGMVLLLSPAGAWWWWQRRRRPAQTERVNHAPGSDR